MKTFILFVAILGAAVATSNDVVETLSDLRANAYLQGISDIVLGFTDPALKDACTQKFPSITT